MENERPKLAHPGPECGCLSCKTRRMAAESFERLGALFAVRDRLQQARALLGRPPHLLRWDELARSVDADLALVGFLIAAELEPSKLWVGAMRNYPAESASDPKDARGQYRGA